PWTMVLFLAPWSNQTCLVPARSLLCVPEHGRPRDGRSLGSKASYDRIHRICWLRPDTLAVGKGGGMRRDSIVLLWLLLFTGMNLFGQGTTFGTIRGTVTDSTGAVVPNAKVVITDLTTNLTRELTTNGQGN